jgi:site-specific recombinase XerD
VSARPLPEPARPVSAPGAQWAAVAARAPAVASTIGRYLSQIATMLAPASVDAADLSLRQFARYLIDHEPHIDTIAAVDRDVAEDYKVWLAAQPGHNGQCLSVNSRRQRLGMIRAFFERIIEWDWPDAPARNPLILGDLPAKPEPLPKFLTDRDAARLMAAAKTDPDPRRRLVVEVLARTGLRASELCDLAADAIVRIGEAHWLRVPLGKLRNDRYVPLHPDLVDLLADWATTNQDHIRQHRRLIADHRGPIDRHQVGRIVRRVGRTAGIDHVHPHQLRHTLATQAINRGMRLEAIAALLGHRSLEMTLIYARITDRVVADEYAAVSEQVDALYGTAQLPAGAEGNQMARLRREAHARLLGNGLCTRPAQLDCRMESACETCTYFQTSIEFRPTLIRQRDHARDRNQADRAQLFDQLIQRVDQNTP